MSTTTNNYFRNQAFREYIFLLVELERLFRNGQGQTPEADAIREAMDFPNHRFEAEELRAINAFADDLTSMSEQFAAILDVTATNPAIPDAPAGENAPSVDAIPPSPSAARPEGSRELVP